MTGLPAPLLTVTPTTVPHHLAFTGAMIAEVAGVGTVLMVAGVVILLVARRRQRPED